MSFLPAHHYGSGMGAALSEQLVRTWVTGWAKCRGYSPQDNGRSMSVLLTDQQPEVREVPIPETLAGRLVEGWTRTLRSGVAADQEARFHDGEVLSFRIGDDRFSGPEPRCGAGELLIEQAEALIDAAGERDPDDFPKRWNALWRLLDELDRELATAG